MKKHLLQTKLSFSLTKTVFLNVSWMFFTLSPTIIIILTVEKLKNKFTLSFIWTITPSCHIGLLYCSVCQRCRVDATFVSWKNSIINLIVCALSGGGAKCNEWKGGQNAMSKWVDMSRAKWQWSKWGGRCVQNGDGASEIIMKISLFLLFLLVSKLLSAFLLSWISVMCWFWPKSLKYST